MSRKINRLSSRFYQQNQFTLFFFHQSLSCEKQKDLLYRVLFWFLYRFGLFACLCCFLFLCFPSGIGCRSQREAEEQTVPVKFNSCWGFPVLGCRLDLRDGLRQLRHTPILLPNAQSRQSERERFLIVGTLDQCTELAPSLSPAIRNSLTICIKQKSSNPKC